MQINEFIETTTKIETYFGKEYETEKRVIMFEELQDMDIDRYKQLAHAVIRKCRYLPKVCDFTEADAELPYPKDKKEEIQMIDCKICQNTGYVTYIKPINDGNKKINYLYVARCNCLIGESLNKTIPKINEVGLVNSF